MQQGVPKERLKVSEMLFSEDKEKKKELANRLPCYETGYTDGYGDGILTIAVFYALLVFLGV